jgi:cytochrome P450
VATGAVVVLRQHDVETLAHDHRLQGVGLAMFDMMGIVEGPLRDWYGRLMFTTEGDYHGRMRSLVSRAFTPRSVASLRETAADMARNAGASARQGDGDLVPALASVGTLLMCRLLAAEADGERLSHDETVTMIANLLIGGHDTTGSQIPCAVMVALQHRDELVAAAADRNRFANAVAELG